MAVIRQVDQANPQFMVTTGPICPKNPLVHGGKIVSQKPLKEKVVLVFGTRMLESDSESQYPLTPVMGWRDPGFDAYQ